MSKHQKNKKLGEIFGKLFSNVEKATLSSIEKGNKKEEDHITGDFLTRLEERVNGKDFDELRVEARQISGRGPNSAESITGADGALFLDVPYLKLHKFYLFQAKKFFNSKDKFDERAVQQKEKMIAYTADSFFLVYTQKGFYWISAAMVGLKDKLDDLPHKDFSEFHKDFFNCFIGDHSFCFPELPFKPPGPLYQEPWKYSKDFEKFIENNPLAKKNILIEINKEN